MLHIQAMQALFLVLVEHNNLKLKASWFKIERRKIYFEQVALNEDGVSNEIIDKEIEIAKEQLRSRCYILN